MVIEGNKITPSEGYQYISNGKVWGGCVYLGVNDSASNWHDTNDEPPEPDPIEDSEALSIITGDDSNDTE